METEKVRAEIVVTGLVQGVGFRYFTLKEATKLDLLGFVQNLYTGDVYTVVEGGKAKIEAFIGRLRIGPTRSNVKKVHVNWKENKNEFSNFRIKYYE